MTIHESAEDYLETILILHQRGERMRAIDVAREIALSKPSVSRAMSLLRNGGHAELDDHGQFCMTDSGRTIAERFYERHQLLAQFLIALGVDEKTVLADSCRMKHVISEESFTHLKKHANRVISEQQGNA